MRVKLSAAIISVVCLGGCGLAQQHRSAVAAQNQAIEIQRANAEAQAAMLECHDKRLSGELKGFAASVQCSSPRIIAAFSAARYPFMDLLNLREATRLALAERVDNGQITEGQMNLQLAQLEVQNTAAAQRRNAAAQEAQEERSASQRAASLQMLQMGLQSMQTAQPRTTTSTAMCNTVGGTVFCSGTQQH